MCTCTCRVVFDVLLLARKCGLIWTAVAVKDPFLGSLFAFVLTVVVWVAAVTMKPFDKQLQLRSLQTVLLLLHTLMLLQASGHGLPTTMTVLHVLWLALLCVVLLACVFSAGVRTLGFVRCPVPQ